jgi:hypothetical protein
VGLHYDGPRLDGLQRLLCLRLDDLLEELGVSLTRTHRQYIGPCPVHGGDKATALTLYAEGHSLPGFWQCYTRQCETKFRPTIIGFIRGVLTHATGKHVGFPQAVQWGLKFLGMAWHQLDAAGEAASKAKFAANVSYLFRGPQAAPGKDGNGLARAEVRKKLVIPSRYFVERGFKEATLDEFDVGD